MLGLDADRKGVDAHLAVADRNEKSRLCSPHSRVR
jgi:hypothetical protein